MYVCANNIIWRLILCSFSYSLKQLIEIVICSITIVVELEIHVVFELHIQE